MQMAGAHRRSMETSSDASYCEREPWDDWGSRSSLSQIEEMAPTRGVEDLASLRAERDALSRALCAARARAAAAARAHDARLAELHGVIAELVRRRAAGDHARAIPEEDVSDECESTTQPAGELDNDADNSRTEQNDTSSALSPELPTPQESKVETTMPASVIEELPTDTETSAQDIREEECPAVEVSAASAHSDTSLNLSDTERGSEHCLSTARWCAGAAGSCERERGSPDSPRLYAACTASGRCESRQAKLASRVKLRKTEDTVDSTAIHTDHCWCGEQTSLERCTHLQRDGTCEWAARCARLQAERRVLQCALARAADTAHRLYSACAVSESSSVSLCCALRAADRALETYDVLLALAETHHQPGTHERSSTEQVASELLARLEAEQAAASIGEPLLSPGPWLQHHNTGSAAVWSSACEARLRAHAARLKADTVALRATHPPPTLFSYHDVDEEELCALRAGGGGGGASADMEAAVAAQEALMHTSRRSRSARPRHWLHTRASETDL